MPYENHVAPAEAFHAKEHLLDVLNVGKVEAFVNAHEQYSLFEPLALEPSSGGAQYRNHLRVLVLHDVAEPTLWRATKDAHVRQTAVSYDHENGDSNAVQS
jgi:hypothetical protein